MRESFRDPSGSVALVDGRVLRRVRPDAAGDLDTFLASQQGADMVARGQLVFTEKTPVPPSIAKHSPQGGIWYEHRPIEFPSYAPEWSPPMLHAAAGLTLRTAQQLLESGWGLKDATPSNILFEGCKPVLVDVLSFERRNPEDSCWLAYAQFVRTFLLPLALNRDLGMPVGMLTSGWPDGVDLAAAYRWLGPMRRLGAPYRTLVTLPIWLQRFASPRLYESESAGDPARARFILTRLLQGLARQLADLAPRKPAESHWTGYMDSLHYGEEGLREKQLFVAEVLDAARPATVLDAGSNTGHFSIQAASARARVVAVDMDEAASGALYMRAHAARLPILPLVANLAWPTPGGGWRNDEQIPLLERLEGRFDMVFALALLHHLLVTDRIPLDRILEQLARLTRTHAIVEYVDPSDEMFIRIVRGRDSLHTGLTRESFERACLARFEILRAHPLKQGKRCLYWLRRGR